MVAGTVIMTVQQTELENGKQVFSFVLSGKSSGLVDRLYSVNDVIRSVYDPESMRSLSYTSTSFGKRKRQSSLVFQPDRNTVVYRLNNDPPKTLPVSSQAKDRLTALYYLRSVRDYTVGDVFEIDVHEGGQNWTVEVHTLCRERIRIDAGEFRTIKVKIRPLHEGVFQNKGVVYLWLTDDEQKVPVLLKSRSRKGDFLFKLTGMKPGTG